MPVPTPISEIVTAFVPVSFAFDDGLNTCRRQNDVHRNPSLFCKPDERAHRDRSCPDENADCRIDVTADNFFRANTRVSYRAQIAVDPEPAIQLTNEYECVVRTDRFRVVDEREKVSCISASSVPSMFPSVA
mgnify:CR=1 FL=1